MTLAFAAFLVLMAIALIVVYPHKANSLSPFIDQQNQHAKEALYVVAFVAILPLAVFGVPRLSDAIAQGPNGAGLSALTTALVAAFAAMIIAIRLSGGLPWGAGVKGILLGVIVWTIAAAIALGRALRGGPWPALDRLQRTTPAPQLCATVLIFGTLLAVTSNRSLGAVPLALGALVALSVLVGYERIRPLRPGRFGWAFDAVLVMVLMLAIPDAIVFKSSSMVPNVFLDPGVVQFQQDYILGPTNQLLGGGALLVNVPVSQYGVGLIYFLAGWFHLAPIGYGTFGFLDSLLTALFYVAAYWVLRLAGVGRLLAGSSLVLGVLAFVYNFTYFVGQLPEEGPLRFGLPMLIVLAAVATARQPDRRIARLATFIALGVSAVWALEAFAYTVFTFAAIALVQAWLAPVGTRRRWLLRQLVLAVAACAAAHVVLTLGTLAATGQLPHWGQYLGYVREFLFGGRAGSISYGFADWSPGLAVDAGAVISAAAIVLLVRRSPAVARRNPVALIALTGTTAYEIAILSYTENRSSTYLLLYVALPLLMAGVLWLSLLLGHRAQVSTAIRRAGLASALAIAILLFAGAWPAIGQHFSRSALAHARPGGGLAAALARLWHPPPIDPRAPAGVRLLNTYMPGKRALVLLPTLSDLGVEILMRSRRSNVLPIGDPKADSLVESVWLPRMRAAVSQLRAGQRLLIDGAAIRVIAGTHSLATDPLLASVGLGQGEIEWILQELALRFRFHLLRVDPSGLIVAQLASRGG